MLATRKHQGVYRQVGELTSADPETLLIRQEQIRAARIVLGVEDGDMAWAMRVLDVDAAELAERMHAAQGEQGERRNGHGRRKHT